MINTTKIIKVTINVTPTFSTWVLIKTVDKFNILNKNNTAIITNEKNNVLLLFIFILLTNKKKFINKIYIYLIIIIYI